MKKKIKEIKPVVKEIAPGVFQSATSLPEGVVVKFEEPIKPLELSLDFGRQDLNETFQKIQEKINELIKKC